MTALIRSSVALAALTACLAGSAQPTFAEEVQLLEKEVPAIAKGRLIVDDVEARLRGTRLEVEMKCSYHLGRFVVVRFVVHFWIDVQSGKSDFDIRLLR